MADHRSVCAIQSVMLRHAA